MKKIILLPLAIFCMVIILHAQVDTINTQNNKLLMHNLPEGTSRYVIYFTDSITGETGASDIWVRSANYGTFHNIPAINFEWKWYHHDSLLKTVRDACRKDNFAPLYAWATSTRQGLRAYNFDNGYLVGADTVAGNTANLTKKVELTVPVFNWEWDMEMFSTLPIKKVGQQFAIAFLDPNDDKPAYYMHTVTGTDALALNRQVTVKCWILRCAYNATAYADFWISQQSHEMLKMKSYFNGRYRYKVKLY